MKVWLHLMHNSLRVVGDCFAAKPSDKHTTTAAGGPIRGAIFLENTNNGIKSKEVSVRRLGEMCNIDYANLSRF